MPRVIRKGAQGVLVAALIAAGLVAVLSPVRSAVAESPPPAKPEAEGADKVRPRRWWLDVYAHTMQERAFIRWMDRVTGGTAWRHTMQEERVNALWVWWCVHAWLPPRGTGDSAR